MAKRKPIITDDFEAGDEIRYVGDDISLSDDSLEIFAVVDDYHGFKSAYSDADALFLSADGMLHSYF